MKKINLRELYPDVYTTDFFVDVTEEVYKIEYYTIANQKQARYNICLLYTSCLVCFFKAHMIYIS